MPKQIKRELKWDDLETFINVGAKQKKNEITINPKGTFTLSSGFVKDAKNQIRKNTYVILSYSKHNQMIVMEFVDDMTLDGVIKLNKRVNMSFAAKSFFNEFNISIEEWKGKYSPELIKIPKKGDCWTIDLKKKAIKGQNAN